MANKRVFYAVQQVGVSKCGENTFTSIHGLQSVGINTRFNLEQVFEIGQLAIYENIEAIPDVEVTLEKVLDGYPPIYLLATNGAATASLTGRSNVKSTIGLSIYSDVQDSASGTPLSQCTMSGMYISNVSYNIQVQGNATESVTAVGNNKVWDNTFTASAFDNNDSPQAISGSGGTQQRQDILFGASDTTNPSKTLLPIDIPGITSSGTNEQGNDGFGAHVQSVRVSCNLGREQLFELGRRGPFHRFVTFPIEVQCDIEVMASEYGDDVTALEDAESNLSDRKIYIMMHEGLELDLGTRNRLQQVTYGGANAGQNGGNASCTYSYRNFNDLSVYHPKDPTTALRP